jgi:hypothetical protein
MFVRVSRSRNRMPFFQSGRPCRAATDANRRRNRQMSSERIVLAISMVLTFALAVPQRADDTAQVIIYREGRFVGGGLLPTIRYDSAPLAVLQEGYFGGIFPAGRHTFELSLGGGAEMNLEAGKSYYLRVDIVPGLFVGSTRLIVVEPAQGAYETKMLSPIAEENVRDHAIPWITDPAYPVRITMRRMREIANGLRGSRKLPEKLRGEPRDVWRTPFRYERSADGESFTLISAGSDQKFDEASWTGPEGKLTSSIDDCVLHGNKKAAGFHRLWNDQLPAPDVSKR